MAAFDSLDTNVTVTEILDAARRSAATGMSVKLPLTEIGLRDPRQRSDLARAHSENETDGVRFETGRARLNRAVVRPSDSGFNR